MGLQWLSTCTETARTLIYLVIYIFNDSSIFCHTTKLFQTECATVGKSRLMEVEVDNELAEPQLVI